MWCMGQRVECFQTLYVLGHSNIVLFMMLQRSSCSAPGAEPPKELRGQTITQPENCGTVHCDVPCCVAAMELPDACSNSWMR